jgi:hypothetical protein
VAGLLVLLLMAPFVSSAASALESDWIPSGDDALIGLRSYDVFTSDAPLTGQPSTSHHYDPNHATAHPGPIEFYVMAIPVRVFGPAIGMLLGITAVNMFAIMLSAWVILRRAGPSVGLWGAVVLSGIGWAEGSFELSDPISSNAGGISLVALAILAWAIVDGDVRLLPVTAFVASWVVQQHLAIVTPAAALALWASVGLGVALWRRHRTGRASSGATVDADAGTGDGGSSSEVPAEAEAGTGADLAPVVTAGDAGAVATLDVPPAVATTDVAPVDTAEPVLAGSARRSPTIIASEPEDSPIPWIVGGVAVLLLCSLPMLIDQFGPAGNMKAVIEFARESDRETLGLAAGSRQALRAFAFPPLLLGSDYTGTELFAPISALATAGGVAVIAALVAIIVVARHRRPALAALSTTALVLAAAGTFAGSNIPESIESGRINFYRWTFVVAVCTWVAIGWAAGLLLRRYGPPLPRVLAVAAPVVAVAVVAVAALATITGDGPDDARRDEAARVPINALSDEMVRLARGHERVTVLLSGGTASASIGPATVLQLVDAGHDVRVPNIERRFWGDNRKFDPDEDPGLILQVVSRHGPPLEGSGRVVLRLEFNPEMNDMLPNLIDRMASGEVRVADSEEATLDGLTPRERREIERVVSDMRTRPARALMNATVVKLLKNGLLAEPELDKGELEALLERLPGTQFNGEDTFELRVLTSDELRYSYPELFR